jgi:hypothetical protein
MPMRAEGDCPGCGQTLGIQVDDGLATMAGSAIETLMNKDDNMVRCTSCGEYRDPDGMDIQRI